MVVGLVASRGSLALLSVPVFAQSDKQEKALLKIDQLSLYTTPAENYRFVEAKPSLLEERISELRKLAGPYTTGLQAAYTTVKPKVEKTVQIGKDGYTFLKNPPTGFYPRAGVIALAGVTGLFLAGRGSRIRKVIYSCGFVAACASLYYPEETIEAAKVASTTLYEISMQGYLTVESFWRKNTNREQQPTPTISDNQAEDVQQSGPNTSS
ncbi:MICOS complex subunit MIC26-like isoform X1 [Carcharodon carcharias]|uniref:MICOS complex subunit MIC26-like isoform X1 n=1 Tax=Carcharodon carcharias TaxID=13397 RepID=UPI001B7DF7E5|nr:MICOS complex subunit MIC26-like isoform X1 [Carcharodon carcharias]XP_041067407.1 MICOS complex subunit MIC26-like isoform X2 [Carcharodon carcharias]XP_041067409.1 MICOS complex subunit MIC26-like isoform X1 [Carcharodon carcharias]